MCRKIHIAEGLQFGRFACCFSVDRRVENLPLVLFPRKGKVSECQHKGHVPPPPSPTFFVSAPYHITDPPHFRFFKFFSFLFFSYPCSDYFGFKAVYFEGTNAAEIADAEDKKNMVQMKEFRIVMPLSLEEFQVAQMYMVMKMQQQSTNGTEGVEVVENRPFEDDELGKGQYTLKIYRLQSKAPTWLAKFAPTDALVMQEEAWNAYPRCKSVIKCLYFSRFILTIETIHKADCGQSENVHGLTKDQLAIRQVETMDIAKDTSDYWSYIIGGSNIDLSQFQSARTGRGPLLDGWQEQCDPVMTAYKLVTIDAPYWGFGSRLEQAMLTGERALFLESHRNCFSWIDEWFGLTVEMMRELEKESDSSLNKKLGRSCIMADNEESDDMRTVPSC